MEDDSCDCRECSSISHSLLLVVGESLLKLGLSVVFQGGTSDVNLVAKRLMLVFRCGLSNRRDRFLGISFSYRFSSKLVVLSSGNGCFLGTSAGTVSLSFIIISISS